MHGRRVGEADGERGARPVGRLDAETTPERRDASLHGGQPEVGVVAQGNGRVKALAVVDDVERHAGVHVAQRHRRLPRSGVLDGVGQRRLRHAQERCLVRCGQLDRVTAALELDNDVAVGGGDGAETFEREREGSLFEVRRAEGPDEPARLGEVVVGGAAGVFDVRAGGGGAVSFRQLTLGCPQQQLDARQALGEGVVDLPGKPLALGGDPGGMARFGQFIVGGVELLISSRRCSLSRYKAW